MDTVRSTLVGGETAGCVTETAMQLLGGNGYTREYLREQALTGDGWGATDP